MYRKLLLQYEEGHPQDLRWLGPYERWVRPAETFISTVAAPQRTASNQQPAGWPQAPGFCTCSEFIQCST